MKLLARFYCLIFLGLFFTIFCEQLVAQEIQAKLMTKQSEDGSVVFSAINNEAVSIYIAVRFTHLEGLVVNKEEPLIIPLVTGSNESILRLTSQENARRHAYRIAYNFLFVNPTEVKPDGFLYYVPFGHGVKHSITQGWNGTFSHSGQSTYAVDFDMVEGENIYAARDGVVVAVKKDSRIGGTSQRYAKHGNYILIRHADNTIASYVHLQFNGALVKVGQHIVVGEHIGYAGKTGLASGPHLHFDLRQATFDNGMQTIPFDFRDKNGNAVKPESHATYYGRFPDGEDFLELRGEDISASTFEDYIADIPSTATFKALHIRKELYDSVAVLFIANAFSYAVQAEVTLILSNMRMEDTMPLELVIPSRKEVFLGIARVQNAEKPIELRSKIRYTRIEDQ